jgi:hypothetical protein
MPRPGWPRAATARILHVRALAGEGDPSAVEQIESLLLEINAYGLSRPDDPLLPQLLMHAHRAQFEAYRAARRMDQAAGAADQATVLARQILIDPDNAAAREVVQALDP